MTSSMLRMHQIIVAGTNSWKALGSSNE